MNKGFTLIELLVVVLIIGILAAVALPIYIRSVEKSRAAEAFVLLRAISSAQDRYILTYGVPTNNFANLDIDIPGEKLAVNKIEGDAFTFDIRNLNISAPGNYEVVATRNSTSDLQNYYVYRHWNNHFACVAKTEAAKSICIGLGGTGGGWASGSNGWAYYL